MKNILISAFISLLLIVIALNIPVHYFSIGGNENLGGTALTDISGSDNLTNFPTTYNANNLIIEGALDTIEGTTTNSTITTLSGLTTADSLTSASALATVGTITSGTWSATDVAVAAGGTGKSSWTQYLIPYADTTTSFSQIAIGTSGQFLTSNGAGAAPTFTTGSVDQAQAYNWTGAHTWTNATAAFFNLQASATSGEPFILAGKSLFFSSPYDGEAGAATTTAATSSAMLLVGDGSTGELRFGSPFSRVLHSTTTDRVANTTTETVLFGIKIPANVLAAQDVIEGTLNISDFDNASGSFTLKMYYGGTSMCSLAVTTGVADKRGKITFNLVVGSGGATQEGGMFFVAAEAGSTEYIDGTVTCAASENVAIENNFTITGTFSASSQGITSASGYAELKKHY